MCSFFSFIFYSILDAKKPFEKSSSLLKKRPSPNSNGDRRDSSKAHIDGSTSGLKKRSKRAARGWMTQPRADDSNDSDSSGINPLALLSTDDDDSDSSSTRCDEDDEDGRGGASNGYPTSPKIRKKSSAFRGFKMRTISSIEARTHQPMLSINSAILNDDFVREFNTHWSTAENGSPVSSTDSSDARAKSLKSGGSQPLGDDTVTLYSDPFTICVAQNFVENEAFIGQLVNEMCQMEWQRKQIDLYEFHQTTDLVNVTKPALKTFYDTLTSVMLPWMETITGLSLTHVSASCSMYNFGDFLLVHDDLLTDRQIAFVYYVSPWPAATHWTDSMGGALELFECDAKTGQPKYPIVKKIPPRNNQFTFFRVCHKSFHQVGEVTNSVYPRLTINGWFHGHAAASTSSGQRDCQKDSGCSTSDSTTSTADESTLPHLPNNYLTYSAPIMDELDLSEWINMTYLKPLTTKRIQNHIEDKSEASLEQFLIGDIYDVLLDAFCNNHELEWILEGPANQRKYETLRLTPHSTGPPKDLHTLFSSKSMFSLLAQYTDLDFVEPNAKSPKCSVQICRFTQGCYTLLGDSSTFSENALDIVLFFNAKDQVGTITYLSPECIGGGDGGTSREADATSSSESEPSITMASSTTNAIATTPKASGSSTEMLFKSKADAAAINSTRLYSTKHKSDTSATSTSILTSGDETAADISSICFDPNEDVEVISIMNKHDRNETGTSSAAATSMSDAIDDDDDIDTDYTQSLNKVSCDSNLDGDDDDDDDDDDNDGGGGGDGDEDDIDDLAQENVLLTVTPKNNALNLVYRTEGQAKFVKYVSKNCIKSDEYVYILFATFKE